MTDLISCARETHTENRIKVGQLLICRQTGKVPKFPISPLAGLTSDGRSVVDSHERALVKQNDATFGATVTRFQDFLGQNQYLKNILWLMPEDVILSRNRSVYVRVPIPDANEMKARKMYDDGVANGRGLLMTTVCEMERSTCCYVWYPRTPEEEPQGLWPHDGSVKLSVKMQTSRVRGKPVKSHLLWALLKLRNRRNRHLKEFWFS